jgi:hypothetical protein
MGSFLSWHSIDWFSLLQTIGIVGGLLLTAYSMLDSSRVRKVDTLINLTEQHRSIWLKLFDTPALKRVLEEKPDLTKHPITDDEMLFVNLVILHLTTVLTAIRKGIFPKPAGQDADLKYFFSLPIPNAAWTQTKAFRDPETVRYVEKLLESKVG